MTCCMHSRPCYTSFDHICGKLEQQKFTFYHYANVIIFPMPSFFFLVVYFFQFMPSACLEEWKISAPIILTYYGLTIVENINENNILTQLIDKHSLTRCNIWKYRFELSIFRMNNLLDHQCTKWMEENGWTITRYSLSYV